GLQAREAAGGAPAGTTAAELAPVSPPDGPAALPAVPGYEVLAELGRGGMGVVYKARDTRLKRLVALKMILGQPDPHQVARFRAEAEAVAQLPHPNGRQIHAIGD